ncbi:hypothetical protein G9A89_009253 [Geosiphon pyriformis]|nr:hypothetical protein G9A89_009253 [Geosiphon pyriformis]
MSVEDIKLELRDVKTEYKRCVEKLEKFMEGEKGDRLEELKKNLREKEDVDEKQRKKWIEEKEELEEEVKELKKSKDRWELQMEKLQDHFIETNKTEHLAKRVRLDTPDNTLSFLQLLCPPFDEPITRSNLEHCFTSALLQKLPAISHLCRDYGNYLVPIDSDPLYNVPRLLAIVTTIFSKSFTESPRQEQRTADGINNHILDMITLLGQCFATPSLSWKRNGKINDTSTITDKSVRPDITVYCNDLLVMIGEEKDIKENILDAAQQLNGYFQFWNPLAFGNLPFVLALAAGGTHLQFYYYYVDDTTGLTPRRETIGESLILDGISRVYNYQLLQYTINFFRILRTLCRDQYITAPILRLYDDIQRSHCVVTIFPDKIIKKIDKPSIIDLGFHKKFYQNTLPGLGPIKVLKYSLTSDSVIVHLAPVGFTIFPKCERELRDAIRHVLVTLEKLHKMNVVHRDIRWDNVLRLPNDSWMLIDFEEAAPLGASRDSLAIGAPEYKSGEDFCSTAGDIWMVGNLFKHTRIYNHISLSSSAKQFKEKLMNKNPNSRPTANDALKDEWFNLPEDQLSIMEA